MHPINHPVHSSYIKFYNYTSYFKLQIFFGSFINCYKSFLGLIMGTSGFNDEKIKDNLTYGNDGDNAYKHVTCMNIDNLALPTLFSLFFRGSCVKVCEKRATKTLHLLLLVKTII